MPYWLITRLFEKRFMQLLGATREVVAGLTAEQRRHIESFIGWMNPVSLRYAGSVFDYTSEVPDRRIAGIRAPTLIVHAKDDTLQPYRNAEVFASTIPKARLLPFEARGHLVAFIEQAAVQAAVYKHISDNLDEVVRVGHEREGGRSIARDAERSPGASVEPVAG